MLTSAAFVNSWLKRTISQFSTNVTRYTDNAKAVQRVLIEQHQSDFGVVNIFLSRDQLKSATKLTYGNSIVLIDPNEDNHHRQVRLSWVAG